MVDLVITLFMCLGFPLLLVGPVIGFIWVKHRQKKRKPILTWQGAILIPTVLFLLLVSCGGFWLGTEYLTDRQNYDLGHQAALSEDCEKAVVYFSQIIDRHRFFDLGEYVPLAKQEQATCYQQIAITSQQRGDLSTALIAYLDLMTSQGENDLGNNARTNIKTLLEQSELSDLASQATCQRIDTLITHQLISQSETIVPNFHLACAESYRSKEKNFEAAAQHLKLIRKDFANSEAAEIASQTLSSLYLEWGQALYEQRQLVEALDKFAQIEYLTDDPHLRTITQQKYDQAVHDLSQDTSSVGANLIQQAWGQVCTGDVPSSPAIGVITDTSPKAWFGGRELTLSDPIKATIPGHFHYAVCLDKRVQQVQRCSCDALSPLKRGSF